jgi:hypothetical protein
MTAGFSHVALRQLNDITDRWRAALTRPLISVPCSNPTPANRLNDVVAEDHVLPFIASICKPLLVGHLGIQLAARRFRHKARKSTANVHQTHNQRALTNAIARHEFRDLGADLIYDPSKLCAGYEGEWVLRLINSGDL